MNAMHVPTHILSGWCVANCLQLDARQRLLCMIAAAAPDIDGIGILFGQPTYQQYHHLVAHNLLIIAVIAIVCASFVRTRHVQTFALCFAMGHLHLLMDYFGSGKNWPIYYLWPLDSTFRIRNQNAWELVSWQNTVAFLVLLAWTIVVAFWKKRTPIELLAPRLEQKLFGHRLGTDEHR